MRRIIILAITVVLAGAVLASAGVVVLKDGTRLEGRIRAANDGFIVTDASGKETRLAAADVQSMQPDKPGGAAQGSDASAGDIATLRRSVSASRDPKQAVEKYKLFLSRNPVGTSKSEAEKDLALWQDRADRGLIKVGEDWLPPDEATQRRQNATGVAGAVAPLIAAGNYAGAETAVDKALKDAPNDPPLLFLKGVILFHKNQLAPARKAFEQVEAAEPGNWAAHNNIAVILFQTRSPIPAIAQYDKAMSADPENQKVLDNVAEALHQLPPQLMKNEVVLRALGRFMEQDALLAAKMKREKGLIRLGSRWVSDDEYAAVQKARAEAEEKISQYRREAVDLPSDINRTDQDLTIKTNAMKAMVQESSVVDSRGRLTTNVLPPHYYELKQEVEQMTAERVLKQKRLDQLPRLMDEAQKQLAGTRARFTGRQTVVEEVVAAGERGPATRPG